MKPLLIILILLSHLKEISALTCHGLFYNPSHITKEELKIPFYINKIFDNISLPNTYPGSITAAKPNKEINYNFHWGRDAAITILSLKQIFDTSEDSLLKNKLIKIFSQYVSFSYLSTKFDPNEPKFNLDGTLFTGPWGRPQRDTPALRVISLLALYPLFQSESHLVRNNKNQQQLPKYLETEKIELIIEEILINDLNDLFHNWDKLSFDVWEEEFGSHFFTLYVIRRALIEGLQFLNKKLLISRKDLQLQIQKIEEKINEFRDVSKNYIVATLDRPYHYSPKNKKDNLDSSVILGMLLGETNPSLISFIDPITLSTIKLLSKSFQELYPINNSSHISLLGPAIGRYVNDHYTGYSLNGEGNPWVITTLAFAEIHYKIAKEHAALGNITLAKEYFNNGDLFISRVHYHSHPDGSLNEQFSKDSGFMTAVPDLTWNYASMLMALKAKEAAQQTILKKQELKPSS